MYFSVFLLVLLSLADETLTVTRRSTSLVCNKGIYIKDKAKTAIEVNVTQEPCSGKCEDCFKQCSNYTEVIHQIKDLDVSGPFNISWTINGEETTYLMKYGLQPYNGILQGYYTVLHFPVAETSFQGTYSTILQCRTSGFARIRVTLLLPAGNRTPVVSQALSSVQNSVKISSSVSVPMTVKVENMDSNQSQRESVNTGVMVAAVLGALSTLTIFILVSAVCLRRAAKNRQYAPDCNLQQLSNNQSSNIDQDIPPLDNNSSKETVEQLQSIDVHKSQCGNDTCSRQSDCTDAFNLQVLHDTIDKPYRHCNSSREAVNDGSGHQYRHCDSSREAVQDTTCHPYSNDISESEQFFSRHIQEQLRSLNLETEML